MRACACVCVCVGRKGGRGSFEDLSLWSLVGRVEFFKEGLGRLTCGLEGVVQLDVLCDQVVPLLVHLHDELEGREGKGASDGRALAQVMVAEDAHGRKRTPTTHHELLPPLVNENIDHLQTCVASHRGMGRWRRGQYLGCANEAAARHNAPRVS